MLRGVAVIIHTTTTTLLCSFGPVRNLHNLRNLHTPVLRPRTSFHGHLQVRNRAFHASSLILPPLIFGGLLASLWALKCTMMVVFQNRIIYMPSMPPGSRRAKIVDWVRPGDGINWREERIRAADGTEIALCVGSTGLSTELRKQREEEEKKEEVFVLYFQGNASSLPPRLPDLSWVLRAVGHAHPEVQTTLVGLSYRGYWSSRGRPSERGIDMDAKAALAWISALRDRKRKRGKKALSASEGAPNAILILWGQSIGCGVATNLAAADVPMTLRPDALVLETPFLSVRAMLAVLYPQKWLPYKHLWPLLRNHLDSERNLGIVAERAREKDARLPSIFILEAGRDEIVPATHGAALHRKCVEVGLPVRKVSVHGAYHNEVIVRVEGKRAVADEIRRVIVSSSGSQSK